MFGSTVLDVAIGLVFVYLIVSLLTSAVKELLENVLRHRAKDLETGIRELLADRDAAPDGIVRKLYNHPLVSSLFQGDYDPNARKKDLPSYIPAHNFALALMDIIGRDTAQQFVTSGTANATAPASPLPAGVAAIAAAALDEPAHPLAALRAAAANYPNARLSKALVALIDAAGGDAARARQNIEMWFNASMDRVSGAYKRRSQRFIVAIGLLLAVLGNIDSVNIVNALSTDTGMRQALVAQATAYQNANANPAATAANPPANPATTPNANPAAPATSAPATPTLSDALANLRNLGVPVGWNRAVKSAVNPRGIPPSVPGWLLKIFGLLLTAAAVSLGAPFWFDILNQIMVVRSTVKPAEKSAPEPSKD